MVESKQAWDGFKKENELIEELDTKAGKIIDKNETDLKELDVLLNELEKTEYLEESESFQKVRQQVKEVESNHEAISKIRDEKLKYEENMRKYIKEVQVFFDNMINNYAENIELM